MCRTGERLTKELKTLIFDFMRVFISADFKQPKDKDKHFGFRIEQVTDITVTEDSRFWWLMGNLLRWNKINFCQTGRAFVLSESIYISFIKNDFSTIQSRILIFRQTKNELH